MAKKVIVLFGSARKKGTTAAMVEHFVAGMREEDPEVEVSTEYLFDLDFKDCRGCLACKMPAGSNPGCRFRDGASELLERIRTEADGLVVASPIYYLDLTAPVRSVMHRLFYPALYREEGFGRVLPSAAVLTMNQPRENYEAWIEPHVGNVVRMFGRTLGEPMEVTYAYQTQPWADGKGARYQGFPEGYVAQREAEHAARWEGDLQAAFEAGKAFATRI